MHQEVILSASIVWCAAAFGGQAGDPLAANTSTIRIASSDAELVKIFNWAKATSEGYVGKDSDPVGPWYEAALPGREAFCIRDVSHQSIGAEILGQGKQNLNMLRKFVENISETKDFCSYWEIDRRGKPAPVDYASDDDFWYNLNANFDIVDACLKLYEWTGDRTYIEDQAFDRFFRVTLDQYVERWQLQAEKIMSRPALMNVKPATTKYKYARGIPSYDESEADLAVSGDLLGMIYNAYRAYAKILRLRNLAEPSERYAARAAAYLRLIESRWWDESSHSYYAFYKTDGKFYGGGIAQSEFLLWYGVIEKPERITKSLRDIRNSQVEVLSYMPMLFYRHGMNAEAYEFLGKIYADGRRAYPEAASGAIEGIARGLVGIEPSASAGIVATCPRLTARTAWVAVENVPVWSGLVSVRHESPATTVFANKSARAITWRAMFEGAYEEIKVDGSARKATPCSNAIGKPHSYVDVAMPAKAQAVAEAATK